MSNETKDPKAQVVLCTVCREWILEEDFTNGDVADYEVLDFDMTLDYIALAHNRCVSGKDGWRMGPAYDAQATPVPTQPEMCDDCEMQEGTIFPCQACMNARGGWNG